MQHFGQKFIIEHQLSKALTLHIFCDYHKLIIPQTEDPLSAGSWVVDLKCCAYRMVCYSLLIHIHCLLWTLHLWFGQMSHLGWFSSRRQQSNIRGKYVQLKFAIIEYFISRHDIYLMYRKVLLMYCLHTSLVCLKTLISFHVLFKWTVSHYTI